MREAARVCHAAVETRAHADVPGAVLDGRVEVDDRIVAFQRDGHAERAGDSLAQGLPVGIESSGEMQAAVDADGRRWWSSSRRARSFRREGVSRAGERGEESIEIAGILLGLDHVEALVTACRCACPSRESRRRHRRRRGARHFQARSAAG